LGEKKELKTKFWECRKQDKTVKKTQPNKVKEDTNQILTKKKKKKKKMSTYSPG